MRILNRSITKEELDNIYEDFKKIEKLDGLPKLIAEEWNIYARIIITRLLVTCQV